MINSTNIQSFKNIFIKNMTFTPHPMKHFILYENDNKQELGYLINYSRNEYYELIIGDYTIPSDFSISFDHNEELMKFGTVYCGKTSFLIEDNPTQAFTPSSFLVVEKHIRGNQKWKKGQRFHGIEIIIHKKFFDEIINTTFPNTIDINKFITNYTYNYLPLNIVSILQNLRNLAEVNKITPLYLESKILECISLISNELLSSPTNTFTNQLNYGSVKIGKNRYITITASDANSIQEAYEILTNEFLNPPTIKSLSKRLFLNEQKLKVGFSSKYNMSINQYITTLKIAMAENLLATTDLSIDDISKTIGYNYSSNFIKMFKKCRGQTPLSFRKNKKNRKQ